MANGHILFGEREERSLCLSDLLDSLNIKLSESLGGRVIHGRMNTREIMRSEAFRVPLDVFVW